MEHEYDCCHEELLQDHTRKISELETKHNFKEKAIEELKEDNRRIEAKIDNLTDTVNKVMLNSIRDDKDIDNRVTSLETKIETQENVIKQYKAEAQKERDDDRAKTNQYIAIVGAVIAILSFIFANILH